MVYYLLSNEKIRKNCELLKKVLFLHRYLL